MTKPKPTTFAEQPGALFGRVINILDQARGNVVRAVNAQMVLAYWLIGREIVQELQGGEARAAYGKQVIADLCTRLTERYGKGFSSPVLWSYRQFYLVYSDWETILFPMGREWAPPQKSHPMGSELGSQGFSPQLTWSHCRALMRVDNDEARDFYEREAIVGGWDKRTLERHLIESALEDRSSHAA